MIETQCYAYNLGQKIDISSVNIEGVEKNAGFLSATYGDVTVEVFQNGSARAFIKDGDLERLRQHLPTAGFKIIELFKNIQSQGYEFNAEEVFQNGAPEEFNITCIPELRKESGTGTNYCLLREIVYGAFELMPRFQAERNLVQAGENSARKLLKDNNAQTPEEVADMLDAFMKTQGIGLSTHSKRLDESKKGNFEIYTFKVEENAFAVGLPHVNFPYCNYVRGLIRGAFAEYLELENIRVEERKCWGLGDTYCEFEMDVFSR